jgi:PAS domain S-box-containing protein
MAEGPPDELDGIVTVDASDRVVHINAAAAEMLGDVLGRPAPEVLRGWPAGEGRSAARARRPDGEEFDVELTVVRTSEDPPLRTGFLRTAPATAMEDMLAAAEALAGLGSWELDLRSGRVTWSDELYRIHGVEPGAVEPTIEVLLDFVHPDDREAIAGALRSVVEHPEDVPPEGISAAYRVVLADGSVREMRAHGRMLRDPRGRAARWVGSAQDVTRQRLSEREVEAHHAVSQALREWESVEDGIMGLLRRLGEALGYEMASLWLWDDDQDVLACRAFWHSVDTDPGHFEYAKRMATFKPGDGKPGLAWQTGEPVITPDAATDPLFRPKDAAIIRGVRSGLAFPAVGPDGPVAVLSFYSLEHRVPSESMVRTLRAIGHDLGRFLSRRRGLLGPKPVTEREIEVLRLAAEGNSGPDIAEVLFISPATVKTHFENIYEKLGVSDRASAVAQALRLGLIR